MPVRLKTKTPIPWHHMEKLVLEDDFGKQIEITHYPVQVTGDSVKGFTVMNVPSQPTIDAYKKMMEQQEKTYFDFMMANHPDNPATLKHPFHPNNKDKKGVDPKSQAR